MASLSEQYRKQRRRIQQAMRREAKKGVYVPDNILPAVPKRITKASVARLEKITPEMIRKKSYLVDANTGEARKYIVPKATSKSGKKGGSKLKTVLEKPHGTEPQKVQTKPNQVKPPQVNVLTKETGLDIQYNNWLYRIRTHLYGEGAELLDRFFSNWEKTIGREETVARVNDAIAEGMELPDWILYHADGALNFINDLLIFFPTVVNQFHDLTELQDYFDDWEEFRE